MGETSFLPGGTLSLVIYLLFSLLLWDFTCYHATVSNEATPSYGYCRRHAHCCCAFECPWNYREAKAVALSTHKFQAKLAEIVRLKTQHPELPLLFYSTNALDREPLISVAIFLAAKLPNPEKPFLNPFNWETTADSPLKIGLAKLIKKQSLEGDKYFAKIADFRGSKGRCIAVVFSGFTENSRCEYLVRVLES
jgi:hypothetical protein